MFFKTPAILRFCFPYFLWKMPADRKVVYLTFDDGPLPGMTDFVLQELEKYQVKATFFCVGDNVRKHPETLKKVVEAGHVVGNHTFHHLTGWKTETEKYLENVALCEKEMRKHLGDYPCQLMRPPHGRIKNKQAAMLRKQGYRIVMWDVLSQDYDRNLSKEKCLDKTLKYTRPGSVVVFHDSLKAEKNLKYVLPRYLEKLGQEGYSFEALV